MGERMGPRWTGKKNKNKNKKELGAVQRQTLYEYHSEDHEHDSQRIALAGGMISRIKIGKSYQSDPPDQQKKGAGYHGCYPQNVCDHSFSFPVPKNFAMAIIPIKFNAA
jgi:hypothetical protein